MRVLATWAAGRACANVVSRLVASDVAVRALVLPGDPHARETAAFPQVDGVEGDLCGQQSVDRASSLRLKATPGCAQVSPAGRRG